MLVTINYGILQFNDIRLQKVKKRVRRASSKALLAYKLVYCFPANYANT